ncbi:MAG: aminomethyl-transferring glycine dehydrogenase subunit GcvPA [Deltaproteobacteria bacterium]|nr:aminomethyl-transferring glycine dehydrogenase subunit GcvPA [Deltaproteobacteria bacterium]
MRYLPHTEEEVKEMLSVVGKASLDDIFSMVPENSRVTGEIELPQAMTEWELNRHMDGLAATMNSADRSKIFVGAGSYHHYIPETVRYLISRSEFATAYTPYQPEISQGTLQGIFEYQTLVASLLGLDVANASLYDGATALAEALLMSIRITKRKKVAVSQAIHPLYRQVVATYFRPTEFEMVEIPYLDNGRSDLSAISDLSELAAVVVQSPNFFGVIEDLQAVGQKTENEKTLFICCFSEPLAYGLLKSPGSYGADISCGEGQSFGIPQSFGGPGLGMFACKGKYMRNLPGRLVGQTEDVEGKRGFVLTLATREQHIRREKATSNICSNQGLCAMASAIYMASVGGTGIKELALLNRDKSEYLKQQLRQKGHRIVFDSPTFNEFVVDLTTDFEDRYQSLMEKGIMAGLPLAGYYPELAGCYLMCVTETMEKADMDNLIKEIG